MENPSFELGTDGTAKSTGKGYYSPYQWTATNLPSTGTKNFGIYSSSEKSDTHPGAFGVNITPDDGDYYFFGRESWNGSFDVVTLSQETKASLPAGKYLMSISYKIASLAASGGYIEISTSKETTTLGQAKSYIATKTAKTLNNQGYMEATPWEKLAVPFEVTEKGKITVSIAMHFNPTKNNVQQEAMAIDNVKIFDLDKASKDNSIDMSGLIMNQNFNISKEGWNSTTKAQNQTIATNQANAFTIPFYENWNGSAVTGKMYTTVNNLPNGTYSVGIAAFVNTLGEEGTQYVYAGDNKVNLTSTTPTAYTIENIKVTNGTLELGLVQTAATANWLGVDNVSLTYYGPTDEERYNIALDKAKTTLDDEDYINVTGTEKTDLTKVIEDYGNVTSNYDAAIEAINNAVSAFTSAKTAYDYYAANHESADAIASALGVETPSAPTTAAEATAYFEKLNVAEYNAVSTSYANDLTAVYDKDWTSNSFDTTKGQHWSGVASKEYPNKWSSSATVTATKTVTLPAGKWVIKAAGRSSSANATLTMTDGTNTVAFPAKGDTGYGIATDGTATFASDATYANDNNGSGWEWRFIPLTLTEKQDITITVTASLNNSWASFSDLTILADKETTESLLANADDYKAFNKALTAAEAKTLGFDKDEYAPYNNVEALEAIEKAKSINTEDKNSKDEITALTKKLSQWTANTEAVDIVYNGNYATVEDGANYPKGWTRTNAWGQMQTSPVTAYYNQPGSLKYGDRTGYTMPLKANTLYKLTFQYASWENNSNKSMTASVLSASNEGLQEKTFAANGKIYNTDNAFVTATAFFTTGAAADYVLTLTNKGNTVITGVSIVEQDSYVLDEDATAAPDALTAPVSVTYNRTFKQCWNSIVLPFATTPEELGAEEAVAFTGTDGNTIKFKATTSLDANKPYMIYFSEEKAAPTFTSKTVSPTTELTTEDDGAQFDFVGSYVANTNPVAGDYIVVTKGIQKAKGGNTMKAFRAYFKARSAEASAKAMTISIDGEAVTGIEAIDFNDALQGNEPAYNLAGQRVAKNYKGVVIRNGKKTINK